jgi:uncharacterized protein YgbK (DUF1537 family)
VNADSIRPFRETLDSLPALQNDDVLAEIRRELFDNSSRLFVLDDDPTGPQTVRNVAFLTVWDKETLKREFHVSEEATFILTNSRSVHRKEAVEINFEVGTNLRSVSSDMGLPISVISRSDSTLRGHFPHEIQSLAKALYPGQGFDGLLFVPFFKEGGRYTIDDVQYALEGDSLIPVSQTPFAKDTAFGYQSSNLLEWMEEKYQGTVKASDVVSISIEDIRGGGPQKVQGILESLERGNVCIVNAADMKDLDVVALSVLRAEKSGKRFLYRTSASFVRSRIGQAERPLLTRDEISTSDEGGALILVGSHVQGSTRQLEKVLGIPGMKSVELSVRKVIEGDEEVVNSIVRIVEDNLSSSRDITVFTSRELITGESPEEYLDIGAKVTDAMSDIVRKLSVKPRYIVSKGGMTSSSVTKNALNMKRAQVPGQVLPGVLVLEMGDEAKYPGTRLILFPGNVGDPNAIADVVQKMNVSSFEQHNNF